MEYANGDPMKAFGIVTSIYQRVEKPCIAINFVYKFRKDVLLCFNLKWNRSMLLGQRIL